MKKFVSVLANFFFILSSSLAILVYSLNLTLSSPQFLKASLKRAEIYPGLAAIVDRQIGGSEQIVDTNSLEVIGKELIDDTFAWLGKEKKTAPQINLTLERQNVKIAFVPPEYEETTLRYFAVYQLLLPLSLGLSVLFLLLRILIPVGATEKLRAVASSFLGAGIPGFLVIISPLLVSGFSSKQEFPEILLPIKAALLQFLDILVWRLTLIQLVLFGMMVMVGIGCHLLFYFFIKPLST